MAPTDTFIRQVEHEGAEIGERYADGGVMYPRDRNSNPESTQDTIGDVIRRQLFEVK